MQVLTSWRSPTLEPESPITNKGKHKYTISKKNVVAFIGDSGEVQKRATFFIVVSWAPSPTLSLSMYGVLLLT